MVEVLITEPSWGDLTNSSSVIKRCYMITEDCPDA